MVFEVELDNALALKLQRVVVIRDRRLGFLRFFGLLNVMAYFLVKKLYIDQSYLETFPVKSSTEYVILDGERARPTELPYCKEYSGNAKVNFQHQCLAASRFTAMRGSHTDLIFLATRVKDMAELNASCLQEELNNGGDWYETCWNRSWAGEEFFVANAEKYRILLQHIASAGCEASGHCFPNFRSADATGEMRCTNGDKMVVEKTLWQDRPYDEFTVQDLLTCAGADLDKPVREKDDVSFRHFGLALSLTINYESNYLGDSIGYYYTVGVLPIRRKRIIPDPERAREVAGQHAYPRINPKYPISHTEYESRNGISIQLQETGVQGGFSLSLFILSSVEALALFKAVRFVVTTCMIYILPFRHIYKALIYERSPRFSDYRKGDPEAIAAMNYLVKWSDAWSRGTRLGETQTTAEPSQENSLVDNASVLTVAELKAEVGSLLARCSFLEAAQAQCSERLSGLELEKQENTSSLPWKFNGARETHAAGLGLEEMLNEVQSLKVVIQNECALRCSMEARLECLAIVSKQNRQIQDQMQLILDKLDTPDGLNKELLSQRRRETETLQESLTQHASNSKPRVDMPPLPDIAKECLHPCLAELEPRLQSVEQSVDYLIDKLAFDHDMMQRFKNHMQGLKRHSYLQDRHVPGIEHALSHSEPSLEQMEFFRKA